MERKTPKLTVIEKLNELTTGVASRSETARLRDIFESIEVAIGAGVSRAAILKTLNENGFRMTLKSFESALYRIRREQRTGRTQQDNQSSSSQDAGVVSAVAVNAGNRLTRHERREALASTFITAEAANPLLQQLNLTSKEKP